MFGGGLPSGTRVYVGACTEKCVVPGYGVLVGYAIFEKGTDEPLQHLTDQSNVDALVKRWDAVLAYQISRASAP